MSVRSITSHSKPSTKLPGYCYAYYNKRTRDGGESVAVFSPAIADLIKPGFTFDDSIIRYDESLKASVLELGFDEPPPQDDPAVPPDPEQGWGDPDYPSPQPAHNAQPAAFPSRAGSRPPSTRKRVMAAVTEENRELRAREAALAPLPPALKTIATEVAQCFLYQYTMLGAVDANRRGDIAQKLTAIACIPYYRNVGVSLTEEDVKAMSF